LRSEFGDVVVVREDDALVFDAISLFLSILPLEYSRLPFRVGELPQYGEGYCDNREEVGDMVVVVGRKNGGCATASALGCCKSLGSAQSFTVDNQEIRSSGSGRELASFLCSIKCAIDIIIQYYKRRC